MWRLLDRGHTIELLLAAHQRTCAPARRLHPGADRACPLMPAKLPAGNQFAHSASDRVGQKPKVIQSRCRNFAAEGLVGQCQWPARIYRGSLRVWQP